MPERTRRASHPPNWPRHRTRDRAPSFQCPPRRTTVTACCRFGAAYGLARVGIPLSACARPHRRKPPHVPVPRRTLPGVGQSIPFLRDSERRGAADRSQCVRPGKRGLGAAVWEHGWRWIGCAGQCDSECTQARCTHVESRTGALVICYSLPSERRGRSTGSRGSGHAASHTHAFDGEHWSAAPLGKGARWRRVSGPARCQCCIRYVKRPQSHRPAGVEEAPAKTRTRTLVRITVWYVGRCARVQQPPRHVTARVHAVARTDSEARCANPVPGQTHSAPILAMAVHRTHGSRRPNGAGCRADDAVMRHPSVTLARSDSEIRVGGRPTLSERNQEQSNEKEQVQEEEEEQQGETMP